MRYFLDFGDGQEGTSPAFLVFRNADTLAAIAAPAIVEQSEGLFYFDWTWTSTATSIAYKAAVNGVELSDVITSDALTTGSGTGVASTGAAVPTWASTAKDVINSVAVDVGLSESSDPYASTDANFIRLRNQLRKAGDAVAQVRAWKVLLRECTITGDGTTTVFDLPADFSRMVDDSGWNRATRWPLDLSSSQRWQRLKASRLTSLTAVRFRLVQGRAEFYDALPSGEVVAFDYLSRYWAATTGAATADRYYPSASTDSILFEPALIESALKVRFLQSTGQDSTAALSEYQAAFEGAAKTEPAQTLSLNGWRGGDRLLRLADDLNWPETGLGL